MILLIIFSLLLAVVLIVYAFMQQSIFGRTATGERLEKNKKSANYKYGSFNNVSPYTTTY